VWELWNVLAQLAVAYPLAYLLMRYRPRTQIAASMGLLVITELLYRLWPVAGFDQAFMQAHNFGAWMDMLLMGKLNPDGWVAINCLPTAAHVIWGVAAGQLLMSDLPAAKKIQRLVIFGAICVVSGYALDPVTPIIKRIATSSFVIVSAGWCLLALAAFYWLIDVRRWRKWAFPGVVVGMNSIFIYLLGETLAPQWLNPTVSIFTGGLSWWMGGSPLLVFTAVVVLMLEWNLCYWLYLRRVFIKI
jgi:predicted acyltransferase